MFMTRQPKLLVLSIAGLSAEKARALSLPGGSAVHAVRPPLPAVTCTSQATFRTAAPPAQHGMVANGIYHRALRKALFWEQSAALVEGERIWSAFRRAGNRVGILFWQQSMGEDADLVLTPAPIHKHHGGMIMDCYSRPAGLYPRLRGKLGGFPLHRYWGPLASPRVGRWIAGAVVEVLRGEAPELLLAYLPTLDYNDQRYGPADRRSAAALRVLDEQVGRILTAAGETGYEWLLWGDYAISACTDRPVFPNRLLRDAGLLACREVRGRLYPDLPGSRAFAMVDHAVAHVYADDPADLAAAVAVLETEPAVEQVLTGPTRAAAGLDHARAGEAVAVAADGVWFAYPWWAAAREAPDYATHVDIHNKPGFDPCELFARRWPPGATSQDPGRIGGTHGRTDPAVGVAAGFPLDPPPATLAELAETVRGRLSEACSSS